MKKVYISLGANLGNRIETIEKAYQRINLTCGRIVKKSSFYKSPPWGFNSEQEFMNSVIEIETELEVFDLLVELKNIEQLMGRFPRKKIGIYEDRLIDLDIIDYDQIVLETEFLTLPHNKMHLRNFVVIPLAEIAPGWIHPINSKSISYIANILSKTDPIERVEN